jgi:acyl-CoA dehydrogenase
VLEVLLNSTDGLVRRHSPVRGAPWSAELWDAFCAAGLTDLLAHPDDGAPGLAEVLAVVEHVAGQAASAPLAEACLANLIGREAGLAPPTFPQTFAIAIPARDDIRLEAVGGRLHAHGTISLVPWGRHLAQAVLVVPSDEGPMVARMALADVRIDDGENLAGEPRDALTFMGAPVEEAALLHRAPDTVRALAALFRSAQLLGALRRIEVLAVEHANMRHQFGQPLAAFQAVKHAVARIGAERRLSAAVLSRAAAAAERDPASLLLPIAKSRIGEAASVSAALAHQILGAMGYTIEHELQAYTRRVWSWRDEHGGEAEWNAAIGSRVCADPSGLWAQVAA